MKPVFEKVSNKNDSSFTILELKNHTDYRSFHFHPEYELTLITRGSGRRFVGDNISSFKKNDLVFVGENLPHCWIYDEEIDAIVIQFSKDLFGEFFEGMPEFNWIIQLLSQTENGIYFPGDNLSIVKKIESLIRIKGLERLISFLRILEELAKQSEIEKLSSFSFISNNHSKQRIDKVFDYIYQNINKTVDVNIAAGLLHMNVSAFCHYFKKSTNKTFSTCVNEMRIGYASKLLIETDKNIAEIAFESGYNSLSNFNKRFRNIKGSSPKNYREKYNF